MSIRMPDYTMSNVLQRNPTIEGAAISLLFTNQFLLS